jgi:hypothetical protein
VVGEIIDELELLSERLGHAGYQHLVLWPVVVYGLGFGLLSYLAALLLREKKMQKVSLFFVALSCLSVLPYLEKREAAEARILATRGPEFGPLVTAQRGRWEGAKLVFLGMGGLAVFCVVVGGRAGIGKFLPAVTLVGGAGVLALALWLQMKESEIYHGEILRLGGAGVGGGGLPAIGEGQPELAWLAGVDVAVFDAGQGLAWEAGGVEVLDVVVVRVEEV